MPATIVASWRFARVEVSCSLRVARSMVVLTSNLLRFASHGAGPRRTAGASAELVRPRLKLDDLAIDDLSQQVCAEVAGPKPVVRVPGVRLTRRAWIQLAKPVLAIPDAQSPARMDPEVPVLSARDATCADEDRLGDPDFASTCVDPELGTPACTYDPDASHAFDLPVGRPSEPRTQFSHRRLAANDRAGAIRLHQIDRVCLDWHHAEHAGPKQYREQHRGQSNDDAYSAPMSSNGMHVPPRVVRRPNDELSVAIDVDPIEENGAPGAVSSATCQQSGGPNPTGERVPTIAAAPGALVSVS